VGGVEQLGYGGHVTQQLLGCRQRNAHRRIFTGSELQCAQREPIQSTFGLQLACGCHQASQRLQLLGTFRVDLCV
jgi:hypothetical protein